MFKKTEEIRNVFGEESKTQKQKNEIIDSVISKKQIMKEQIIKSDVAVKKATPVLKTKDLDLIDINLEGDKKSTFYNIVTTNAGNIIEFKIAKILTFLEDNGFCRLKMPKGGYELIRIERRSIISFADNSDIMKVIKTKVLNEDNWG
ncbi:hypothetical protein SAMN05660477_01671 [Soonwooa buanensis]|uniref:Uncharacterized protein n=1 Tax=Soonwooa buanensis TaxID=619805 RepID=A0A1T5EWF5_9FLAO|nr:hypothetical protein [Soonwooa buanensis]SKB88292.1 hypothetical protein SAMN05660477_01671 [Soonwooa buanensis]